MIDITQLAQDTITTLAPLLPTPSAFGHKALDTAAGEAGKTLLTWLTGHFKGKPAETTLERAIADPENQFRHNDLKKAIAEQATLDPAFRDELARLLAAAKPASTYTQNSTQTGDNNVNTQIQGNNNQVTRR